MPIKAVEPQRLYRHIAEQIAQLIRRGEYRPGERLPPERDLARQLGVSRPSVREALIALEVEGYVEVRVGSGVYVMHRTDGPGAPTATAGRLGPVRTDRGAPAARVRVRGARGASTPTRAQIRRDEGRTRRNGARPAPLVMPLDNDRRFHLEIAEASGNSALALAVQTLWDQRTGPLFVRLEHHFDTPELWNAAITEHNAVMTAIEEHDSAAARAAMRRHMDAAANASSAAGAPARPRR